MKKVGTLLTAALIATIASSASAQGTFGVKGGLSFGSISQKGVLPGALKVRTGFAAGLAAGWGRGVAGIGLEALYAQRGLKSDESLADAETRLDYIDVPAYLKLGLPIPSFQPFVYAGPQVSFEIHCKQSDGDECPDPSGREKTTYAAVIGAGAKLGGMFTLEGRYVYGLTDLKIGTVTSSESFKHRNFLILIGLGI